MDPRLETIIAWIRREACEARGLLVPISGGSDSALAFWLCRQAFPKKTVGVHAGSPATLRCAEWFAKTGPIEFVKTPGRHAEREEMRWARCLAMSLARKAWLVGTRNRTEDLLMTYSLASRVATFLPIVGLWKTEVLELCELAGIPGPIAASSRNADPDCGRPRELSEIPIELIDTYLQIRTLERKVGDIALLSKAQIDYLDGIRAYTIFKARLPIRGPRP